MECPTGASTSKKGDSQKAVKAGGKWEIVSFL
jgi:hypothetical protein